MSEKKNEILDINTLSLVKKTEIPNDIKVSYIEQDVENKAINISKSEDILLTLIAKIIVEIIINEEI